MNFEQHISAIVTTCEKANRKASRDVIGLGKSAHQAIRSQLRRVEDPGERKRIRAETVAAIQTALKNAGLGYQASEVSRWVQFFVVADCFGTKEAVGLPVAVLRAFAPTVRRDPKSETWAIKQALRDQVTPLWQRAVSGELSTAAAIEEVGNLVSVGRKQRTPKPKPSIRDRVVKLLTSLDAEDQRVVYAALHKKFAGQVQPQVVPKPHIEPSIERTEHGASVKMTPPPVSEQPRKRMPWQKAG